MSDRRLVAALGKMSSDNEHERIIGLNAATAILKERGITWAQVAEMITGRTLADMTAPEGVRNPVRPNPEPKPREPSQPHRPGRLQGGDIPAKITGKVRIVSEDKEGLLVEMMGSGWWGPMRATAEGHVSSLKLAADPRNPRDATVITAHRGGDAITDIIDVKVRFAGT
jgi:hypothetical protein